MGEISRPRRGSLAYSPRTRAKSQVPKYSSWPAYEGEPVLQGFAGYKVGMTHLIMVDDHKNSPTEGKDISVPVTILEIPPMKVVGVRAYTQDTYGKHAKSEAWGEDSEESMTKIREAIAAGKVVDVFAIMQTRPTLVTGVPKKVSEIMETRVAGGSMEERLDYVVSLYNTDIDVTSVVDSGQYIDVTAITTGKGTQGPVKRWGIQTRKHKHARGGKKRHIGNLGPWSPHHVRWQVPQTGQTGYQQRTEFNKRILKLGEDASEVNPDGGFLNYGLIRNKYIAIKGSVPGPVKRLIRIRPAMRPRAHVERVPAVQYVSTMSKQG
ncbi:MAG: 50S ribosomal protein L3 [Euryarchaeota archaeon]|nr:50S ribosomal protein L3 [Euryarchaeota archaeon]